MRIALFGGSFDPFHKSHLEVINWCKDKLKFDKVWIIPAYQNRFKSTVFSTTWQRKEIIELATNGLKYVEIIDYEIRRGKPTPTYNTIKYIKNKFPKEDFTFIIGMDILKDFEKWHNFKKLIKMVKFIVFQRDGYDEYKNIAEKYNLEIINFDNSQLTSTNIRNQIDLDVQLQVVNEYIFNNFLYYQNKLKNSLTKKSYSNLELAISYFNLLFSKNNDDYLIYKNAILLSYTSIKDDSNNFNYLKKSLSEVKKQVIAKNLYTTKILNILESLANINLYNNELKIIFLIISYANNFSKKSLK